MNLDWPNRSFGPGIIARMNVVLFFLMTESVIISYGSALKPGAEGDQGVRRRRNQNSAVCLSIPHPCGFVRSLTIRNKSATTNGGVAAQTCSSFRERLRPDGRREGGGGRVDRLLREASTVAPRLMPRRDSAAPFTPSPGVR